MKKGGLGIIMQIPPILAVLCISISLLPQVLSVTKSGRLPNIVFILADDLGYGELGCFGQKKIKTPRLDQMAKEGIRFTDAHSPSTVCTPTRYSIFAGRMAFRLNRVYLEQIEDLRVLYMVQVN